MPVETSSRAALLVQPVATAAAGTLALGATMLADRVGLTILPPCPLHALTGLWCPLCGGTRAVQSLAGGDVATALGLNAFVVVVLPLLLVAWVRWTVRRASGQPADLMTLSGRGLAVVAAVMVAFMVVRNLPGMEALTP